MCIQPTQRERGKGENKRRAGFHTYNDVKADHLFTICRRGGKKKKKSRIAFVTSHSFARLSLVDYSHKLRRGVLTSGSATTKRRPLAPPTF